MKGFNFNPSTIMVNGNMAHELQMCYSADDAGESNYFRRINTIQTAQAFNANDYTFSTEQRQGWRLAAAKSKRQYRKPENQWILPLFKEFNW